MLVPLHICEVAIRNAVADALQAVHGDNWPWNLGFTTSLPSPRTGYNPQRDLQRVAAQQPTTGKVIAELKFAFWEDMFTGRHDVRLWNAHIRSVFPFHPPSLAVRQLRSRIYHDLGILRKLRNRIAHHEPIFQRNLSDDLSRMGELLGMRSPLVQSWMLANQEARSIISHVPAFYGGAHWMPSQDEIALQAYWQWLAGGQRPDTKETDWFEAKRILERR